MKHHLSATLCGTIIRQNGLRYSAKGNAWATVDVRISEGEYTKQAQVVAFKEMAERLALAKIGDEVEVDVGEPQGTAKIVPDGAGDVQYFPKILARHLAIYPANAVQPPAPAKKDDDIPF